MTSTAPNRAESLANQNLKRLAWSWALNQGFKIAAAEVALPERGSRIDVDTYKPQRTRTQKSGKTRSCAAIGTTAIFECKAFKVDFRRDARSMTATMEKLKVLHAKKLKIEEELKVSYTSIRNGDSLFQEFETLNFDRPGYERHQNVIEEIRHLTIVINDDYPWRIHERLVTAQ